LPKRNVLLLKKVITFKMSFAAVRSLLNVSRISASNKVLLANALKKNACRLDVKNTRTLTRSLFFLCRSRDSDNLVNFSSKVPWSNKCSCGCALHTKGDQELAAFLVEEIENETRAQPSQELPKLEGFECKMDGAEVTLTKKLDNETITIKSNVNNSVDAEDAVLDPNDPKQQEETEMKAKPEFTVEIKKGNKILSFLCTYSQSMPDEGSAATEEFNDSFQISEISLYEGEFEDSTYTVSGEIMDGYLYDLLMNYLEERGVSNEFADKMIAFFTAYEHKLYVSLLRGMKLFVEK